jgi:hypothetical protein
MFSNWENFNKFNVFYFCGFLQHLEKEKCVDNAVSTITVGLGDETKLVKCSDERNMCSDKNSLQCL